MLHLRLLKQTALQPFENFNKLMITKSCSTEYNSQMNGRHTSATEIKPKRKINSLIICLLLCHSDGVFPRPDTRIRRCNALCCTRGFSVAIFKNGHLQFALFRAIHFHLLPKTRIKYNGFTVCKYLFASIEMRSPGVQPNVGTCECTLMHAVVPCTQLHFKACDYMHPFSSCHTQTFSFTVSYGNFAVSNRTRPLK